MEETKKIKRLIINFIIFILLIILTFSIVFKDQDVEGIFNIVANVKKEFLLIAILAMCIYVSCEAINLGRVLKEFGEKSSFLKNVKYTLIGAFFNAITPAATGGQPMEIYYMHKEGISVAHSTLSLLMQLAVFQVVSITLGIVSAIIHFDVLKPGLIWLFLLGITLNSSALVLFLIGIFSKRLSKALIGFAVKVLKFFRIRNIEQKQEKLENELAKYHESSKYIKEHKTLMLKNLLTTIIQMLSYYSVSYCVYLALGYNSYNIWQILTLSALVHAIVSGIPLPGAVGVSEGGFIGIFSSVFPQTVINSAVLLNRGINFYLLVIISFIVVMANVFINKKEKQTELEEVKEEET